MVVPLRPQQAGGRSTVRTHAGAEVALLNPLEAVLGPICVYAAGFEAPSQWTLLGGALLVASLLGHEAWGCRAGRAAAAASEHAEKAEGLEVSV